MDRKLESLWKENWNPGFFNSAKQKSRNVTVPERGINVSEG